MALADGEPADRVARQAHGGERLRRAPPQREVRSALHNAEQRLARRAKALEGGERALRPAQRQLHRAFDFRRLSRQLEAFVELHLDVGAELALNLDRPLGREHVARAVEVRLELGSLLGDAADLGEAHDLEPARVGEDRPVPAHEPVQPAEAGDALRARAQHQVIGVGENDVGAGGLHLLGIEGLHGRDRADRHECRRAHDPARRRNLARARVAVRREDAEAEDLSHRNPCRGSAHRAPARRGTGDSGCSRA